VCIGKEESWVGQGFEWEMHLYFVTTHGVAVNLSYSRLSSKKAFLRVVKSQTLKHAQVVTNCDSSNRSRYENITNLIFRCVPQWYL